MIAFTVSVLVAVGALQIADLLTERHRALRAAERRAANAASVLAEYVRGSFAIADASLAQLTVHSRQVGGALAPPPAWGPLLQSAMVTMRGTGSISVADIGGIIRHSTNPQLVGESRRDQFIYRHLSVTASEEFVVDTPYPTAAGRYVIPIGRRLSKRDGAFDGVIVTSLNPDAYRDFIRTIDVGVRGSIGVFHPEGVVVFQEPSATNRIGASAAGNPVFEAALHARGNGVSYGPLTSGGPEFVSAYHTLQTPPLVVAVSLERHELLTDWRRQRRTSSIAFAALTLALAGIVFVLFRQIDARGRIERELGEVQRLEAERLRDANERLEGALAREQQALRETQAASYMKDEFVMTLSHELRTPLTAIFGWVRMLGSGAVPTDERTRALAAIERNARAQLRLVEELLDVSRAISGKLRIDARPILLNDVVLEAVETVRPALNAKAIQFEASLGDSMPIVADPDRVRQMVWNLLSNAIKFTPDAGRVRLRVFADDGSVVIEVSDSGAGISPDFLPHVFERFRQAEGGSKRRYGGLGLGLAIVRHLAELHGGSVSAESAGEHQGATFRVRLPRAAQATAAIEPPTPAAGAGVPTRLDDVRVLVVDDDPDTRELFATILTAAGATVLTAASTADAMRFLRGERDLVLVTDIEMPEEDGYQLLARARGAQDPAAGRRLIAIAVTAYGRAVDRQRALEAGFDAHLAKPIDPEQLVAALAGVVTARGRGQYWS